MMKLQKPVPKSLAKVGKTETSIKKKKKSLVQNAKKHEAAVEAVGAKKSQKSKLIEETIVKVAKDEQKKKKKQKSIKTEQDVVPPQKQQQEQQKRPEKKEKQKAPKSQKQQADNVKATPSLKAQKETKKNVKKETAEVDAKNATLKNANKTKNKKPAATEGAADKPAKQMKKEKAVAGPLSNLQKKKSAKLAFKKEQIKNKKKTKKPAPTPAEGDKAHSKFEPAPFDEDKFHAIVNETNIRAVVKALKTQVETQLKSAKNKKIFSDYRYCLNVAAFKIPNCPKRMVKLNLKHSLVGKDDDVVMVVTDLQRGAKADYEPTIQHYEDLLREAGVEGIKVMPFNQLRNECNTYETVRKLSNTYDYFMCDSRIVSRVAGFCGKIFQKPRTTFHSVRLVNPTHLKNEITKSMRRTAYKQLHKGDLISIPVGNHNFSDAQLAENIMYVVAQLGKVYAGGLANIRKLMVKIDIVGTLALPIYMSMSMGLPPAETPSVIGPREQRMTKMKREANGVLSKFGLTKEGKLVKLSQEEIERKLKSKKARALLSQEKPVEDVDDDDEDEDEDEEDITGKAPVDNDGDETVVPAKKARKEESSKVDGEVKKKDVEDTKAGDEKDSGDAKGDEDADENGDDDDDDDEDDDDPDSDEDLDDEGEEEDDVVEGAEDDDDDDDEDDDGDDDDEAGADDDDEEGDDLEESE